jgi:hypothetical protein
MDLWFASLMICPKGIGKTKSITKKESGRSRDHPRILHSVGMSLFIDSFPKKFQIATVFQ